MSNPTSRPNLDANKLANVRRDIVKNKRLSETEIENIRTRIRETLTDTENNQEIEQPHPTVAVDLENEVDNSRTEEADNGSNVGQNETYVELKENVMRKWEELKHQEMNERDYLCKISNDKKTKTLIKQANKVLKDIKMGHQDVLDLTSINQLCYAAASVVTEMTSTKKQKKQRKRKQPKWKEDIEKDIKRKRGDLARNSTGNWERIK